VVFVAALIAPMSSDFSNVFLRKLTGNFVVEGSKDLVRQK
jgi:hypothetical protein